MAGFITGLGVEVFTNQVRKILAAPQAGEATSGLLAAAEQLRESVATSVNSEGYFVEVLALIYSIPHANLYSVAVGLSAFVIVRLIKRYSPKVPGALVALVLLTTLVAMLDLSSKGVGVLGNAIPSGAPAVALPTIPLADYPRLLPGALAIVAILLCEGLLVVRSYANKYNYKADGDQMLFAYGVANLAAGFTGSLLTGNSPSRSAAMDASGAQPAAQPGSGRDNPAGHTFLRQSAGIPAERGPGRNRRQCGPVANRGPRVPRAVANAPLGVLDRCGLLSERTGSGTMRAVIIAFLLTTIDVVRRASTPGTWVLRQSSDGSYFVSVDAAAPAAADDDGLVVYRFGSPLYFANANLFSGEVERLVTQGDAPIRWFVLDAQAISDIDTTGAEVLHQVFTMLGQRDITIAVTRASPQIPTLLQRYGLLEFIERAPTVSDQPACSRRFSSGVWAENIRIERFARERCRLTALFTGASNETRVESQVLWKSG